MGFERDVATWRFRESRSWSLGDVPGDDNIENQLEEYCPFMVINGDLMRFHGGLMGSNGDEWRFNLW